MRTAFSNPKYWLALVGFLTAFGIAAVCGAVCWVDPYFVFRHPKTDRYYYVLDKGRLQNPGLMRHFGFGCMMVGSSMTQNFRSSELSRAFGLRAIRFPYEGGSLAEYREAVEFANTVNTNIELVIVCLDTNKLLMEKDWRPVADSGMMKAVEPGNLVSWLKYLIKEDAILKSFAVLLSKRAPGMTDFDDFEYWMRDDKVTGKSVVMRTYTHYVDCKQKPQRPFDAATSNRCVATLQMNVVPMIARSRKIVFFFPPYSMVTNWVWYLAGLRNQYFAAEELCIREILKYPNARIFSWNDKLDLVSDLDNYVDAGHYCAKVNSKIIEWIRNGEGEITAENCELYLAEERKAVEEFDYEVFFR